MELYCAKMAAETLTSKSLKLREKWLTGSHIQVQAFWNQVREEIESLRPGMLCVDGAIHFNFGISDDDFTAGAFSLENVLKVGNQSSGLKTGDSNSDNTSVDKKRSHAVQVQHQLFELHQYDA